MAFVNPLKIDRVCVLGVRSAEQTKVLATYNSTIYCILIIYANGRRELSECTAKEMEKYLNYIEV
jgi:hypothetical protein